MRAILAPALAVLVLSGCEVFDATQPVIGRNVFTVSVEEGDLPTNVNGMATYYEKLGVCAIVLRKYPTCLAHEMRHCVEGAWHDERPNSEDC